MDLSRLLKVSRPEWRLDPHGAMRVPAVLYGERADCRDGRQGARADRQCRVSARDRRRRLHDAGRALGLWLPDRRGGGVRPRPGGVVLAGGVGFDISCGVRTLLTGLKRGDLEPIKEALADSLFHTVPAGLGSRGRDCARRPIRDGSGCWRAGRRWAVEPGLWRGRGSSTISRSTAAITGAPPRPPYPSARVTVNARKWARLGSGNHYLEVQEVTAIFDPGCCRGLWARTGRYRRQHPLRIARPRSPDRHRFSARDGNGGARLWPIELPDLELACAPIRSDLGTTLSGRDARRHQLRAGQPPDHHLSNAPGLCPFLPANPHCRCCSMSRTTPAKRRSTKLTVPGGGSLFTAKGQRAHLAPVTVNCRPRSRRRASRSLSAEAWGRHQRSWPVRRCLPSTPLPRPAMVRADG